MHKMTLDGLTYQSLNQLEIKTKLIKKKPNSLHWNNRNLDISVFIFIFGQIINHMQLLKSTLNK